MPKPFTMPFIIDNANTLTITKLTEWHYLKPFTKKHGSISWSTNGIKTSSITILIEMKEDTGVLTLSYSCNEIDYKYNVQIISSISNLGKGNVFYFICPFTYKTCRKLHLYNGRFIHRSAISGGMYSKQIHTKKWRQIESVYGSYFDLDLYYEQLNKKYFKTHYKGISTKKYLKIMSKIKQAKKIDSMDVESLLIFGY
jgi:hypothetical protein